MSRKDFYSGQKSYEEIINVNEQDNQSYKEIREEALKQEMEAESDEETFVDEIEDEEAFPKDICGAEKRQDLEMPHAKAEKDYDLEVPEKAMKKDEYVQENGIERRENSKEWSSDEESIIWQQADSVQALTDADGEREKLKKDLLIRKGRIAILELIREKKLNVRYAPQFLQQLVAQTQGTTLDNAQYFLQQIIAEQKESLDRNDGESLKKLIKTKISMNKETIIQMWIKEYKDKNPLTLLTDFELEHLANGESIFREMTPDQMLAYNAQEGQRLETCMLLYKGIASGLLLALGGIVLSGLLDSLFG
ncbi:uncharacterized protein LOC108157950 [Drosophila miranda]|uniref:uncharacterized protein LOC108157950 n=1 Tax=Drosophila miranda TaxID=7229 RepID=UPI0007E86489|nr:uncharacterized protein LOC108157950 [Drosophila miranda]XP_017145595.1 uncharacterized protein LOC108157950 [Drosophila miranda]